MQRGLLLPCFLLGSFVLTPTALAQVPLASASLSPLTLALQYIDDPSLTGELKLSAEQVRNLRKHADAWFQQWHAFSSRDLLRKGGDLSESNEKALREILNPEQRNRLKQLVLQMSERRYGLGRTVRHPEVADQLGLGPEQAQKLLAQAPAEDVLTRDQMAKWKEMLGPPIGWMLQVSTERLQPTAPGRKSRLPTTPLLEVVRHRSVQREAGLTPAQFLRLFEITSDWQTSVQNAEQVAPMEARPRLVAEATGKMEKAVDAVLKPEQKLRLQQIVRQLEAREHGWLGVLTSDAVKNELRLDSEQQKKIAALDESWNRSLEASLLAAEGSEKIAASVHPGKRMEKVKEVLEREQQAKLRDLVGEPFTANTSARAAAKPVAVLPLTVFNSGLGYLYQKYVQEELNITREQLPKLTALLTQSQNQRNKVVFGVGMRAGERWKQAAELDAKTEKELGDILDKDQVKRFREVTLQILGRGGKAFPLLLPEITAELQLTDDQQDRLDEGEKTEEVLTEKQLARWHKMLGEPSKKLPPLGPSPRPAPDPQLLFALGHKAVLDELKLTDEQYTKLRAAQDRWRDGGELYRGAYSGSSAYRALMTAVKEAEDAVAGFLKPEQLRRLQEIERQRLALTGFAVLLEAPEVAKELALTKPRREQLDAMFRDEGQVRRLIIQLAGDRAGEILRKREAVAARRAGTILTEAQHTALKRLLGEPLQGDVTASTGFGLVTSAAPPSGFDPPR